MREKCSENALSVGVHGRGVDNSASPLGEKGKYLPECACCFLRVESREGSIGAESQARDRLAGGRDLSSELEVGMRGRVRDGIRRGFLG